jgi:hypothetical protein
MDGNEFYTVVVLALLIYAGLAAFNPLFGFIGIAYTVFMCLVAYGASEW